MMVSVESFFDFVRRNPTLAATQMVGVAVRGVGILLLWIVWPGSPFRG